MNQNPYGGMNPYQGQNPYGTGMNPYGSMNPYANANPYNGGGAGNGYDQTPYNDYDDYGGDGYGGGNGNGNGYMGGAQAPGTVSETISYHGPAWKMPQVGTQQTVPGAMAMQQQQLQQPYVVGQQPMVVQQQPMVLGGQQPIYQQPIVAAGSFLPQQYAGAGYGGYGGIGTAGYYESYYAKWKL